MKRRERQRVIENDQRDKVVAVSLSMKSSSDVERMTELYQQACAYADRCDTLLQAVEAEVMLWDPDQPEAPPQPLNP